VADGGDARPESASERGLPVAGGGGPSVGSGGEARVLERRSRRGVGTGGRVDAVALERRGRRRDREGKKREGDRWGSRAWGCHAARGCHGAWPRPACVARQQPERGARGRQARACRPDRAGREGANRWAAAQCRAAVPLTGGASLSAGAVESAGARGPAREESGVAEPR
jgi:hypothetical protein